MFRGLLVFCMWPVALFAQSADLNQDGLVDLQDFTTLASQWLSPGEPNFVVQFQDYLLTNNLSLKKAILIDPDANLQERYDWLKSPSNDSSMGPLSAGNRRTLIRMPGAYYGNLCLDTNYVDVQDLVPGSVTDTGLITITASDVRTATVLSLPDLPPPVNYVGERILHQTYDGASLLADINNKRGWEVFTEGRLVPSVETDHVRCGSASLRLTKPAYPVTEGELRQTGLCHDLSNCHGLLRVYLPAGCGATAYTNLNYICLRLYTDAANYNSYILWNMATTPATSGDGWYELHFCANWTTGIKGGGGADLTRITQIGVLIGWQNVAATVGPAVVLDELLFYKPKNLYENRPFCR